MNNNNHNNKPKILILIMSASTDFFRNQVEDCKQTWLSVLNNKKYRDIINKYVSDIDWLYYDTVESKYELARNSQNQITDIKSLYPNKKVIIDNNDKHHLYNVLMDDKWTWQKTFDVFDFIYNDNRSEYKDYDYIIRTNTSTYINIILLSYILYKNHQLPNKHKNTFGVDLIGQPGMNYCPGSGDIYCRGNCIVLSKYIIKNAILKYGQLYNSTVVSGHDNNVIDDVVIGNILNCFYNDFMADDEYRYNYLDYIIGLPFMWYKCVNKGYEINHPIATDGLSSEFKSEENILQYSSACAIQVKSYVSRNTEHEHYIELHENMCKYIYNNIVNNINILEKDIYETIKEYQKNPAIFILGNLPYMYWNDYINILKDNKQLEEFEKIILIQNPIDTDYYYYKNKLLHYNN